MREGGRGVAEGLSMVIGRKSVQYSQRVRWEWGMGDVGRRERKEDIDYHIYADTRTDFCAKTPVAQIRDA
jgi:hypothetical protein